MSNITAYTPIPDGTLATPGVFNSRLSQIQLNVEAVESRVSNVVTSAESLVANSIGTKQLQAGSVISMKIGASAVNDSHLSAGDQFSAKRFTGTESLHAVTGDPVISNGALGGDGLFWTAVGVAGPASASSLGIRPSGAGGSPPYYSETSQPSVEVLSGDTTFAIFHGAGLVISNRSAPSGGGGTGYPGDVRFVKGFAYFCHSTDSWQRVALSDF